jgi:hypothetical protein
MATLARIVDPEAVSAMAGPSARLEIRVPGSWAGREIEVVVPPRVTCSRCDGGGCDSCNKSGAFKLGGSAAERAVLARLPGSVDPGVVLRLLYPLGDGGPLETLLLEVRADEHPSGGVSLAPLRRRGPRAAFAPLALAIGLALLGAVLVLATR